MSENQNDMLEVVDKHIDNGNFYDRELTGISGIELIIISKFHDKPASE